MTLPARLGFGVFLAPFHATFDNPTLALERDLELLEWLDHLGYDVAWIGEHHSCGGENHRVAGDIHSQRGSQDPAHQVWEGAIPLPYHHPLIVANRMVLLDRLTRGRIALGVGPGALNSDGHMLGIDHQTVRRRMEKSLDVIMRLLTEKEPLPTSRTGSSSWTATST